MYNVGNWKPVLHDNLEGGGGRELDGGSKEGGVTHIPVTDSCWCVAEAITILLSNNPSIKMNKFFKKLVEDLVGTHLTL